MGEAEETVRRRMAQSRAAEQAQTPAVSAFIAEVRFQLIPQISAMLRACNYIYGEDTLYGCKFFTIDGEERVAWKIWYDGWESYPEAYITADGGFIFGTQREISTVEKLVKHHGELLLPQQLENLRKMARGEPLGS